MDFRSKDTLLKIEQNSNEVTYLQVGVHHSHLYSPDDGDEGVFNSRDSDDYDRLGTAIGNNTRLNKLEVSNLYNNVTLNTSNKRFYDGIRHNSSISELMFTSIQSFKIRYNCVHDIESMCIDVAFEVLRACQEKNILTKLHINTMPLVNSGEQIMSDILRGFTNLRQLTFVYSELTDDQLLPIVEVIRGYTLIEMLDLAYNNIGDTGCEAVASLRNVAKVDLSVNGIGNEGMISIANSLCDNNHLRELLVRTDTRNQIDLRVVADYFAQPLCNTSSINDIYLSNHTLESIAWGYRHDPGSVIPDSVAALLKLNKSTTNKRHVAIKKILLYYTPDFDMEPLFDLSLEGDEDLKALPYVISWFETAKEAIIGDRKLCVNDLECKKISAIYQFVTAMPMIVCSCYSYEGVDKKRKSSID